MQILPQSDWIAQADGPSHVMLGIYENNGHRHWIRLALTHDHAGGNDLKSIITDEVELSAVR